MVTAGCGLLGGDLIYSRFHKVGSWNVTVLQDQRQERERERESQRERGAASIVLRPCSDFFGIYPRLQWIVVAILLVDAGGG